MAKKIFKVGDRVFDIRYGWGKVTNYEDTPLYPIGVVFDEDDTQEVIFYTEDGKGHLGDKNSILSFTEYEFSGFSQKRITDYNKYIGKWGKFWDDLDKYYIISKLEKATHGGFKSNTSIMIYDNFEPLTEEQIKILNLK